MNRAFGLMTLPDGLAGELRRLHQVEVHEAEARLFTAQLVEGDLNLLEKMPDGHGAALRHISQVGS